jgi:hypothetical protein
MGYIAGCPFTAPGCLYGWACPPSFAYLPCIIRPGRSCVAARAVVGGGSLLVSFDSSSAVASVVVPLTARLPSVIFLAGCRSPSSVPLVVVAPSCAGLSLAFPCVVPVAPLLVSSFRSLWMMVIPLSSHHSSRYFLVVAPRRSLPGLWVCRQWRVAVPRVVLSPAECLNRAVVPISR